MEKEQLTSNQLKVINYLLQNDSIEAASKKAKVARGTIYAWLKLEAFKNRLEDGRNEIYTEGLNALKVATRKASITLIELLDNSDRNTRRLAAKTIIDFAIKAVENKELEERICVIEEALEQQRNR